jgi:hypothetical protein
MEVVLRQKKTSKPSVAPFFQRVEAAFQKSPRIISKTIHVNAAPTKPARSPSSEADDLIQALRGLCCLRSITHVRLQLF